MISGCQELIVGVRYEYKGITEKVEAMGLICILVFIVVIHVLSFLELHAKRSVIYDMLV